MKPQIRDYIKNCALHELDTVIVRLVYTERKDEGHYPFHNWQFLRRLRYNHADFEWDESVDLTWLFLLTTDPIITLPYNTLRGFDMRELNVSTLYSSPAQGAYINDIHILVGVARVRQEDEIPTHVPHLLSDCLRLVYATPHHQSRGERPTVNLWIIRSNQVGDHSTMNQAPSEPCEVKDCVFLRRIHEARENAENADNELWKWVYRERELYRTMGREDDVDDEDDGDAESDAESAATAFKEILRSQSV